MLVVTLEFTVQPDFARQCLVLIRRTLIDVNIPHFGRFYFLIDILFRNCSYLRIKKLGPEIIHESLGAIEFHQFLLNLLDKFPLFLQVHFNLYLLLILLLQFLMQPLDIGIALLLLLRVSLLQCVVLQQFGVLKRLLLSLEDLFSDFFTHLLLFLEDAFLFAHAE